MSRIKSMLNYLAIALMLFMLALTVVFLYSSGQLKSRITVQFVQKTELVAELITHSVFGLMSAGHSEQSAGMVSAYGNVIGIEDIAIFKPGGQEAFAGKVAAGTPRGAPRKIMSNEEESFKKAAATMLSAGFFDWKDMTYSQYVPMRSEGACVSCHAKEGELLGVLKIKLTTGSDFELLRYLQRLIWTLWFIVFLPVGALFVAGAIIREKNKLNVQLEQSAGDLRKTYNELAGTRSYLQMILDNSKVMIITTDTDGNIVEFNREAEKVLGYSKDEVAGKNVLMLYDNPEQRAELINRGRPVTDDVWAVRNREVVLRTKQGKRIYSILTLSTMIDDVGKIIGTVGVSKDISEQKMLQFKLLQSEKLAGIGTLASGIAHEINNPLAGILGMAEAIRDEDDMALIKSYTNDIIQYAVNAGNIVKELSSYSRSAHNEANSTIDVAAVLENSIKMAKHSASFGGVNLVADLQKDCFIIANSGEVQQVFVNLIINAVHAMNGKGTLTLKSSKEDAFVKAVVSDTGHGIAEEHLSQIFDPFFTTKPVGIGTGLGLYVVYRIVTKNKGTIDVYSKPGCGATFTVKFPLSGYDGAGSQTFSQA